MHPLETALTPLGRALRGRRADESLSVSHRPEFATDTRISVTSTSFSDGEIIPAGHCGWLIGDNLSPALAWSEPPAETQDLLLILEDIDVPRRVPGIHTIAVFAPDGGGLPEGALKRGAPGIRFLPHRGRGDYHGPRPIPGHGPHRYRFHLYALASPIDMTAIRTVDTLASAVAGHVLASGTLTGTREA